MHTRTRKFILAIIESTASDRLLSIRPKLTPKLFIDTYAYSGRSHDRLLPVKKLMLTKVAISVVRFIELMLMTVEMPLD